MQNRGGVYLLRPCKQLDYQKRSQEEHRGFAKPYSPLLLGPYSRPVSMLVSDLQKLGAEYGDSL